jgi:hypothetical protein
MADKQTIENKDKEALRQIHYGVHGIRLVQGYKPTPFEFMVAKVIAERFAPICKECRDKLEVYNKTPTTPPKKDGFMKRLNNALENSEK